MIGFLIGELVSDTKGMCDHLGVCVCVCMRTCFIACLTAVCVCVRERSGSCPWLYLLGSNEDGMCSFTSDES